MKTGRPPSSPESAFPDVLRWHGQGFGCRRIAVLLEDQGVHATKSSVARLIRGLPPYKGRWFSSMGNADTVTVPEGRNKTPQLFRPRYPHPKG